MAENHVPAPFVFGAARSGNTLLRLMLDAHPELAIPPETDFIPEAAAADTPDAFMDVLTGRWGWRLCDLQIDLGSVGDAVRQLAPFDAGEAIRVVYRTYASKFGKPRWGDKTPRYFEHMPLVARLLPEARFVHIIRDGRDAWLSARDLWFGPTTVEDGARSWLATLETARAAAAQVPHYREVKFEQLVLEPEGTLRELCEYLELAGDPSMLRYHERAQERIGEVITEYRAEGLPVVTVEQRHSIHRLTGRPPDASRIGVWRRELTDHEAAAFEAIAGEALAGLGYEVRSTAAHGSPAA